MFTGFSNLWVCFQSGYVKAVIVLSLAQLQGFEPGSISLI